MKNFSKGNKNTRIYIYLLIIIICGIFLFFYLNKWKEVKEEEKYLNSYLVNTGTVNLEMSDIKEINTVLSETPSYYFVYISYTKEEDVYNLEKELKPLITEYDLQNNFYYINVTDIKEKNENFKEDIAKELKIDSKEIKKVPIILYFKEGKLVQSGVHDAKSFEKLLKDNNIKAM